MKSQFSEAADSEAESALLRHKLSVIEQARTSRYINFEQYLGVPTVGVNAMPTDVLGMMRHRLAKWCTHCRADTHNDEECWSTRAIPTDHLEVFAARWFRRQMPPYARSALALALNPLLK